MMEVTGECLFGAGPADFGVCPALSLVRVGSLFLDS